MKISIKIVRDYGLVFLAALISMLAYLLLSQGFYGPGFPLDDAWIYQTYARNLAWNGEWAFLPGVPSGGSTGPLWAFLLGLGYWLNLNPLLWTWLLGWFSLVMIGILGMLFFSALLPEYQSRSLWIGLILVSEWHLVWAAGSGMETLGFAALVLLVLGWLVVRPANEWHWLMIGLLIGLSVWLRPDGITLLGPAGLYLVLSQLSVRKKITRVLYFAFGFGLIFIAYLSFNWVIGGSWWPTTYYAKQQEYLVLQSIPLWIRWLRLTSLPLVGVGVVLAPGFIYSLWLAWSRRMWGWWLVAVWLLGYIAIYAWRLPVSYQHGRYLIPAMTIYYWMASMGMVAGLKVLQGNLAKRVISRVWTLTAIFVLLAFWGLGARSFANDVAVIETEMVATAKWIAEHTPAEAVIAAHDIGALGYFGQRAILDLAGLVSPDVIPFIRDETRLARYLDEQGADYLMTFPSWYPELTAGTRKIFITNATISPSLGGDNMAVYRWPER